MASSSRFAVALHALTTLAFLKKEGVEWVSSAQIAKSINTHPVLVRNLLASFKTTGLIVSKEGKEGGVALARSPKRITLSEIYQTVETQPVFSTTKNPVFPACPVSRKMKPLLQSIFTELDSAILQKLNKKTLDDLLRDIL